MVINCVILNALCQIPPNIYRLLINATSFFMILPSNILIITAGSCDKIFINIFFIRCVFFFKLIVAFVSVTYLFQGLFKGDYIDLLITTTYSFDKWLPAGMFCNLLYVNYYFVWSTSETRMGKENREVGLHSSFYTVKINVETEYGKYIN